MIPSDDSLNSLSPDARRRVEEALQRFGNGGNFQGAQQLNSLSPEKRMRVENALQALRNGTAFPDATQLNSLPPETRIRVENALQAFGNGTALQGETPVFITHANSMADQQTRSDKAWAHWEYGTQEWALFDRIDWGVRKRTFSLLVGGGIVFLIATIFGLFTVLKTSSAQSTYIVALLLSVLSAILCLGLFIFSVVYRANSREASKRHKARYSQPPSRRVTISAQGIWEAGTYFPLHDSTLTVTLRRVEMTTKPSVLHFYRAISKSNDKATPRSATLHVLVPQWHEAEADALMQRFRSEVIQSSAQVTRAWSNPPEPD